ncbi:MAG TPA: glycosyltransferase family 39 protein, partial [Candidatus Polarisedimenticolaceae bacterium]|nr:glycosyltransferase family 39 protein [Candidatus Polarisedimenticolaceae bacterium]
MKRPFALGLAAVVLLAFAWRAAHVVAILGSPLGESLAQDAHYYHEQALRLLGVSAAPLRGGPSFMNLGYPYLLAAVYRASAARPAAALWVQALCGALTAGLVALAARRLLQRDGAALFAGLLYAVYGVAIFFDGLLLTPSPINLLLALALWGVAVAQDRDRSTGAAVAAGLTLGAASLLRANLLLLVPVAAL